MRIRSHFGRGRVTVLVLAALVAVLVPASAMAQTQGGSGDAFVPAEETSFDFASAGEADIRPGVVTNTKGGKCTSNFIFTDGDDLYIGQAAHCAGKGPATATNGCQAKSRPLGTEVKIAGPASSGTLVYSSWLAMQRDGTPDPRNACQFNDFALVKIPENAEDTVNPTVRVLGGPTGLAVDEISSGETVYSYGNSPLRVGPLNALNPKVGQSFGTRGGGWTHIVFTLAPGVPGDSGSGFLGSNGLAFGTLSTLALAPVPGSNGVTDLSMALEYANEHGKNLDEPVRLVGGTEPFNPPEVPLLGGLF